jgi:hypothetical protein
MKIEEAILLTLQGQNLALRCRPQKRPMRVGDPNTGSNQQESGPPIVTVIGVTERKRRTNCTQLINKAKSEQLILSKLYPSMWLQIADS